MRHTGVVSVCMRASYSVYRPPYTARTARSRQEVKTPYNSNGKLRAAYYVRRGSHANWACACMCVGARNWAEPLRIGSAAAAVAAYLNPLRNELLHGQRESKKQAGREDLAKLDLAAPVCNCSVRAEIMNIFFKTGLRAVYFST